MYTHSMETIYLSHLHSGTGDFMKKVPTATCALIDRQIQIVSIERVYTPSTFYMKSAVAEGTFFMHSLVALFVSVDDIYHILIQWCFGLRCFAGPRLPDLNHNNSVQENQTSKSEQYTLPFYLKNTKCQSVLFELFYPRIIIGLLRPCVL